MGGSPDGHRWITPLCVLSAVPCGGLDGPRHLQNQAGKRSPSLAECIFYPTPLLLSEPVVVEYLWPHSRGLTAGDQRPEARDTALVLDNRRALNSFPVRLLPTSGKLLPLLSISRASPSC